MKRKKDQEIIKKILVTQSLGSRKAGSPKLSWRGEVEEDARMFEIRNWWVVKRDHDEWKGLLEESKIQR